MKPIPAILPDAQRLQSLLDSSHEVLTLFDKQLRHVFVNKAVEQVSGLPRSAFLGKTNRDLGMPDERCTEWEHALNRVLESQQSGTITFEFRNGNEIRHFESHLSPVFDESGNVAGVFCAARDVTAQVRSKRMLEGIEQRLNDAVHAANAGAWEWNPATGALTWSEGNRLLHGFDRGEQPSLDRWLERIHPEDRAGVSEALEHAASSKLEQCRFEFRVRHPVRGVRWLVALGRMEKVAQDDAFTVRGLTLDITHRKEELAAVDIADRFKDEFIATLSHELRNALSPISNAAGLLARNPAPEQAARVQETLLRQVRHAAQLLGDLGDLASIKQGRIAIDRRHLDLREPLRDALDQAAAAIQERPQLLVVDLPEELPVSGDPTRLVQVFANLVLNAVKYTPPGGHVTVRGHRRGDAVIVRVEDDGIGIDESQQARVFEMFARVPPTGYAVPGLGIGLALVRRLVDLHGGHVALESAGAGHGTRFIVTLPADSAPA